MVENADEIKVTLAGDKKEYDAEVIGTDPKTDIAALLEIKQGEAAAALADLQEILADVIKETLP